MSTVLNTLLGAKVPTGLRKQRRAGAEPIRMCRRKHKYFPEVFLWRGHRYHVYAVERCWTKTQRRRGNRVERHCFRVRCPEGVFDLFQDVQHNTWHLERRVA